MIYEYKCKKCSMTIEETKCVNERDICPKCPKCNEITERIEISGNCNFNCYGPKTRYKRQNQARKKYAKILNNKNFGH